MKLSPDDSIWINVATVGLGVSDFGYRISHDWFRWCFGAMAMWPLRKRRRRRCPFRSAYILLSCTAMALQSIRLFQSLLHCICSLFFEKRHHYPLASFLHTSLAFHITRTTSIIPNKPPSSSSWLWILAPVLPLLPPPVLAGPPKPIRLRRPANPEASLVILPNRARQTPWTVSRSVLPPSVIDAISM